MGGVVALLLMPGCDSGRDSLPWRCTLKASLCATRSEPFCAGNTCADAAGSAGPTVHLHPGPSKVSFDWAWDADNYEVALCRGSAFRRCISTVTIVPDKTWTIDLRPGKSTISVFATWRGGDASYEWFVDVGKS